MTLYEQANNIVSTLPINQTREMPVPEDVAMFRKYLSAIALRKEKKFKTKLKRDKLIIMHVPYYEL